MVTVAPLIWLSGSTNVSAASMAVAAPFSTYARVPPAVTVGASLLPVMVTVTTWLVPSAVVTVKVSLKVAAAAKACTVALALLSV